MSAYSADNANVNYGSRQSVFTELKELDGRLVKANCNAHALHNTLKKVTDVINCDTDTKDNTLCLYCQSPFRFQWMRPTSSQSHRHSLWRTQSTVATHHRGCGRPGRPAVSHTGGRPPSWIRRARIGTTHLDYLVVCIVVLNLVEIAAVLSII